MRHSPFAWFDSARGSAAAIGSRAGVWLGCAAIVVAISGRKGCGDNNGGHPAFDASAAGTIGPAGGNVTGSYGAQVDVPPGALSANVAVAMSRDSRDAPPLPPQGLDTAGAPYALTPHGTAFAHPVTVTIPFDGDRIPTDAIPTLYAAEQGGSFAPIATTMSGSKLSAQLERFSWVIPGYASTGPRVVYALTSTDGAVRVSSFKIGKPTGGLSAATSSAVTGDAPISVSVHPSRRFLYVTNGGESTVNGIVPYSISVYALDVVTGAISGVRSTQLARAAGAAAPPIGVVIHPTGKFLYVINHDRFSDRPNTDISVFAIDATTGALVGPASTADSQGAPPAAMAFSPSGDFAYVAYQFRVATPVGNAYKDRVKTFAVDRSTGALRGPIGDAPAGSPWAIVVEPTGRSAYVASIDSDTVSHYSIDQHRGILTLMDSVKTQGHLGSLAMDSRGRFLYAGKQESFLNANLLVFKIDGTSGGLTLADSQLTGTGAQMGPISVVAEPQGEFLYIMVTHGEIVTYRVQPTSGALTSAGPPLTGVVLGGAIGGAGYPFTFAASGTSPVWADGCTQQALWTDESPPSNQCFFGCVGVSSNSSGSGSGGQTPQPAAAHALSVVITGGWPATIISTPAGIDYSTYDIRRNHFVASFPTGTTVKLCETPGPVPVQAYDVKWTGTGGCSGTTTCTTVTMTHDEFCQLQLTPIPPR